MDAGATTTSAPVQCPQRLGHEAAVGSEDDRGIERFGWKLGACACPDGAKDPWRTSRRGVARSDEREHLTALMNCDLADHVRR